MFIYALLQKRQCNKVMELPIRVVTGTKNEIGALSATTENLPRNVVHTRLDGRNQSKQELLRPSCLCLH